jgi:hypothetical protein
METDISQLLEEWPHDPDNNIRRVEDADGNELIQVRVEDGPFRGILQMNIEGRPDGTRPHGCDYVLDFFEAKKLRAQQPFQLTHNDCKELFDESRRVYERYVFLLQLADYPRVIEDTNRNMRLFRFVHEHAGGEDDRINLQRWWPYVLRINGTARSLLAAQSGDRDHALSIVAAVRREIDELNEIDTEEFHAERTRSLEALNNLEKSLIDQQEATPRQSLQKDLAAALAKEAYELAAELRDRIQALEME